MNIVQRKYAVNRIEKILQEKLMEMGQEHNKLVNKFYEERTKRLDDLRLLKIKLVDEGKVRLKKDCNINPNCTIDSAFDFSNLD
jgi:DNA integrity scanning protein DisA with diadenylate cyclase activity